MAGLSFMESFALGYMAAGSGPDWGATLSGIQTDYRYKQALAQADADYAALVNDYNRLVDGFNEIYRIGSRLRIRITLSSVVHPGATRPATLAAMLQSSEGGRVLRGADIQCAAHSLWHCF